MIYSFVLDGSLTSLIFTKRSLIFVLFKPYVRFRNFCSVRVTEWRPIIAE